MSNTNYRKIWENNFGKIPLDEQGRSYEIHHIDGNRKNNKISNLVCVSIEEHFNLHFVQQDWAACQAILMRLNNTNDEIRLMALLENKHRVENGTHPWLKKNRRGKMGNEFNSNSSSIMQKKRIINGTHNWLRENGGGKKTSELNKKRIENGTHNFLGPETNQKRIDAGTHNFLGKGNEVREKNKADCNREIVLKIKEIKNKFNLKLGSGWVNKSTESLEILYNQLLEKYNEQL